jgi:hypothetical protein
VDGDDQCRAAGGDVGGDGVVIGGVECGDTQFAFRFGQVPVAGDDVAVAAGRHRARIGGVAVEIDHQAGHAGDDCRGRQRPRQPAGERIGADIHGDMIAHQRGGHPKIDAGRHIGGGVIGHDQHIGRAGQDFGQAHGTGIDRARTRKKARWKTTGPEGTSLGRMEGIGRPAVPGPKAY